MNMEKTLKLSRCTETKHKVFEFTLAGNLKDCIACINILNVVDLDEHGIEFLCLKEDGVWYGNGAIKFKGLIEVKKGTTIEGMMRFFRALDIPLWDCISLVSLCEDVNSWLEPCFERKTRPTGITLEKGGIMLKKGTLRVPTPEDLPVRKGRWRWD